MPSNVTFARYGARLFALGLGWLVTALQVSGATLDSLVSPKAISALVFLIGLWIFHVLTSFADTGVLPDVPAAEKLPAPGPAPLPDPPPVPAA